ncbi:DUF4132 domain-containing protein [Clostridium ganghwense]|uniref:DUF4132 domain-containing protein n=1 Tax=Clostridium ganghwense TaxID=312089 RepID=A0ABT4CTZ8_9CLOT|nr:DUF4132 domain-containing protein [Clostridium ganghwense]MCY6371681.1 DUF4132 domain-containing protein [Clostridium ganghwense]
MALEKVKTNEFTEILKKYNYGYRKKAEETDTVIEEIKAYLLEEKSLDEVFDFVRDNLKGERMTSSLMDYYFFQAGRVEKFIIKIIKAYKEDNFQKRLFNLLIKLNPYRTIELITYGYDRSGCDLKSIENYEKIRSDLKNKFKFNETQILSWALGYSYGHYTCGPLRKQIYERVIEEVNEKKNLLKEAVEYIETGYRISLYGICYEITKDEYFNDKVREYFYNEFNTFLDKNFKYENEEAKVLIKKYTKGEVHFEEIKPLLKEEYRIEHSLRIDGELIYFWALEEEERKKYFNIFFELDNVGIINSIWSHLKRSRKKSEKKTMENFLEEVVEAGIEISKIVEFLGIGAVEYCTEYYNSNVDEYKTGIRYLTKNEYNVLEYIKDFSADSKLFIINSLFESKKYKEEHIKIALEYLKDKSKKIREALVRHLSKLELSQIVYFIEDFKKLLENKKADVRLAVTEILVNYKEEKLVQDVLQNLFKKETDPKIRSLLIETLNIEVRTLYLDEEGKFDLLAYIKGLSKNLKKKKLSLPYKEFTQIRYKHNEKVMGDEIIEYFLLSYMTSDELKINNDALLISEYMNEEDLNGFSNNVLDYFISNGFNNKEKWMILLASIHGDYNIIKKLNTLITELASKSKQKIASYIVKALALNGSGEALILVDSIGRKFKYKSVKDSAKEAFKLVASELGYSLGELQDKIVPDLGFKNISCKEYDYGSRKFKVYLNDNLALEIEKDDGKILKNLPKGTKDDNEEMVKKAKDNLKILKKELKDIVKAQIERMEASLSDFRIWNVESWRELFMKNPIMHRLGKRIIWGLYEDGELKTSFIYDDDFYNVNDDVIELDEKYKISIVHPLELSEEEKASWKEIFEDNEIEEFFPQINRNVFICEDENIKFIEDFKNTKVNDATLVNRIMKKGWYRGSVTDGGGYHEFYKENEELNIGVEVTLDEYINTYDLGYEEVAIKTVEFYKAGTIERGSYEYDEIDSNRRILPINVPERYYSEMIYDIYEILSK